MTLFNHFIPHREEISWTFIPNSPEKISYDKCFALVH